MSVKKIILASLLSASLLAPAFAQPAGQTFTLRDLTLDEVNLILEQLSQMPWKASNPILHKLLAQLNQQRAAGAAPPAPVPPEAPK